MYLLLSILILASVKAHHPESEETCPHDAGESWTYRGDNGPEYWKENHPMCDGQRQSPIDIVTSDLQPIEDENQGEIEFENYDVPIPINKALITNNGHSVELEPQDGDNVTRTITIDGKTYIFRQLHFHWGCNRWSNNGSEHTIDGQSYPLEMHLVHTTENDEEIAVIAVFFGWWFWIPHTELQIIVDRFHDIHHKGDQAHLNADLTLGKMLPWWNTRAYYTYEGSLTTPPCTEGVRFYILKNPTVIAPWQLAEFRDLHSAPKGDTDAPGCKLCGNNRPVQELNERTVTHRD